MNWLCLDNIFRDSSSKTVAHGQRYDTSLVALLYCSLHCSGCLRAGTRYQVLVYDTSGTKSTPSPAFCPRATRTAGVYGIRLFTVLVYTSSRVVFSVMQLGGDGGTIDDDCILPRL